MAKQNQKELTPKEIVRKFLEDKLYQNVAGSNRVRSNPFLYGQLGVHGGESTYEDSMNSDEVKKIKEQDYNVRKREGEFLEVFGEPSYPTNYDVSLKISKILEENKRILSLGDLEGIVKNVADGFEFSVPKELRDYTSQELYQKAAQVKAEGEKEVGGLSEQERDALVSYEILSQAYDRGIALRSAQSGYFADLNQAAKQISEKYIKSEEK